MSTMALIAAALIPLAWTWSVSPRQTFVRWFLAALTCYGLLVGAARFEKDERQRRVDSFDSNRNGFVDGNELTAEAKAAILDATADTGRGFAPITGAVAAPLWTAAVFLLLRRRETASD